MTIKPCDYWSGADGGCFNCPAEYCNCCVLPIEKDELIKNLEEAKENIQKMLDRLREL